MSEITNAEAVREAAAAAVVLFQVNEWRWRDDPNPPTAEQIEAKFWSLLSDLVRYRDEDSGWGMASRGRLVVVRQPSGDVDLLIDVGSVMCVFEDVEEMDG